LAIVAVHETRLLRSESVAEATMAFHFERPAGFVLERELRDLLAPVYSFAGPPGMTMAMQSMLEGAGISGDDMRSEEFYGY
jgi:hypothetical protein